MIWNGKIILFYRKSTYFKECDELCLEKENDMLIKGKYSYEFGDWKTHIATNEHTKFADALKNLVFFRTCSDIPCITGIESRSAVCLVLANKVAAGSINPPIYLKNEVYESDGATGVFKELSDGALVVLCDSFYGHSNSVAVMCKYQEDKVRYKYYKPVDSVASNMYRVYHIMDLCGQKRNIRSGGSKTCVII